MEKLINTLKNYKEQLIIDSLRYKLLNPKKLSDYDILIKLEKFDDNKTCFGDLGLVDQAENVTNFGIYLDEKLIGYFGSYITHAKYTSRKFFAICLKKEYRGIGIGKIVLKQMLNLFFSDDFKTNSIYMTAIEDNDESIHLIENSGFHIFKGFRELDYFDVNGEEKKQKQYLYTKKEYLKDKDKILKYGISKPKD